MAPPNPMSKVMATRLDESHRLGIVDDRKLTLHLKTSDVLFVVSEKDFKAHRRHVIGTAMKSIVKRLSHLVEIVSSGDDGPTDCQTQLLENGDQAGQDFRDSPTQKRMQHFSIFR